MVVCASRIAAQASIWRSSDTRRASSRPSSGAVSACVSGTPKRAGPMIGDRLEHGGDARSVARARAALSPARASATPPASAIQKPAEGAAREARNDAVATWASPDGGAGVRLVAVGGR